MDLLELDRLLRVDSPVAMQTFDAPPFASNEHMLLGKLAWIRAPVLQDIRSFNIATLKKLDYHFWFVERCYGEMPMTTSQSRAQALRTDAGYRRAGICPYRDLGYHYDYRSDSD